MHDMPHSDIMIWQVKPRQLLYSLHTRTRMLQIQYRLQIQYIQLKKNCKSPEGTERGEDIRFLVEITHRSESLLSSCQSSKLLVNLLSFCQHGFQQMF